MANRKTIEQVLLGVVWQIRIDQTERGYEASMREDMMLHAVGETEMEAVQNLLRYCRIENPIRFHLVAQPLLKRKESQEHRAHAQHLTLGIDFVETCPICQMECSDNPLGLTFIRVGEVWCHWGEHYVSTARAREVAKEINGTRLYVCNDCWDDS